MTAFDPYCRASIGRLFARGDYVPGAAFAVRPGPGYGDMMWAVCYGERSYTNAGMHTREIAERYARGYQEALAEDEIGREWDAISRRHLDAGLCEQCGRHESAHDPDCPIASPVARPAGVEDLARDLVACVDAYAETIVDGHKHTDGQIDDAFTMMTQSRDRLAAALASPVAQPGGQP